MLPFMIKIGKGSLLFICIALLISILLVGCKKARTSYSNENVSNPTEINATYKAGIANPASLYCVEKGFKLELRHRENSSYRVCVFPDGSECEEWSFYRGKCSPRNLSVIRPVPLEESKAVAESWIRNAPTYAFDGQKLEFVEEIPLQCPFCWLLKFRFESRHSGYGNRRGINLLEAPTKHEVSVIIQEGKIRKAIIDNQWDEVNQKMLSLA